MRRKTINVGMSKSSIDNAIKEIRNYQQSIIEKSELLALRLAEIGVGIAEMKIGEFDAVYSGTLISSMKLRKGDVIQNGAVYYVYTDCPWAKFVEFGTGIVGQSQSHPMSDIFGWRYDINNHGEHGWFYFKDGEWHWTNGMPSRPFMLETAWELSERIAKVAREVFSNV